MEHIRFSAAACQTDMPNPIERRQMRSNTDRMLAMIDDAVAGSAPFLPVRLVVFPEFAHAAPVFPTVAELLQKLTVPIPNEHTDRLTQKAREHNLYIQSGSMLEEDPRWPGAVFNTSCLIGPEGILSRYRKVNPWIPYELHTSPHDLAGYDEPLFPVVETPIGRIGCAICYDWLFPEAIRQLAANGAELLVRVSAYMDPWGATEPMNWWTLINRARALENIAYVVAANQGASLRRYPPYSWPGGSQVVDFDGRLLAEASPGPGERIVVAPVDVSSLRHERQTRIGHHMPAHLRTEAYPVYRRRVSSSRERRRCAVVRRERPPDCGVERGSGKAIGATLDFARAYYVGPVSAELHQPRNHESTEEWRSAPVLVTGHRDTETRSPNASPAATRLPRSR